MKPVYPAAARALRKLGQDVSLARRARRITVAEFALRMRVSPPTLRRLERGDPGVSLNTLAMALHVLGRLDLIADIVDLRHDDVALMLLRRSVPRRVSKPKPGKAGPDSEVPTMTDEGYAAW